MLGVLSEFAYCPLLNEAVNGSSDLTTGTVFSSKMCACVFSSRMCIRMCSAIECMHGQVSVIGSSEWITSNW